MGRGRSITPERLSFLHMQVQLFQVQPHVPAGMLNRQGTEQVHMQLYLELLPQMDRFEVQVEEKLGKLLHQERITLRALLMGRLRETIEQATGRTQNTIW
ncbi:hypothetical protein [Deinococcus cellulosilyticus]|uniref:Uncharacterized protein n=1 Tax=Deinococcus cellulosilyticus (strain DSM 18568 / NBRC 106333 / KACC 11606 / 5516J-15) TaxID=1223518 RepID=A0A511N8D9_DEIC1|nr:hypothetical protein [Deinococcus cellulosilyticus]GEM49103.1 hypothetical protein DC3_47380 [Deinococcus cellulosilyticus NBRC 106333 = KACC 11606]